jgi:uncharacterized peroxidase-related enzyme
VSEQKNRIPLLEREQVTAELAPLYDKLLNERGVVPNMFKTVAHVPALALGFAAFLKPLMGDGHLPALYKELIATRVAFLNHCEYCVSSHSYLARLAGGTEEQIKGIEDPENGPFDEREKAGFRYANAMHPSAHAIDDAVYASARQHFTDEEMIELTAVAAAFEFFPRFVNALAIPTTPVPEQLPARKAKE